MNETLTAYPFDAHEKAEKVEISIFQQADELFSMPLFETVDKDSLISSFKTYFAFANMMFCEEEKMREEGVPGANLYYHGRPHAVFQATYDALSIVHALIERNDPYSTRRLEEKPRVDPFLKHLTPEVGIAIVFGSMFHDTGYVSDGPVDNYALRLPIHVEQSIRALGATIDLFGLPSGLDDKKVKRLGKIGIHGTHFPFTVKRSELKPDDPSRFEEIKSMIDQLPNEERKEAQIVRLAVQLADLGGQCARPDYFPDQVINLRDELNEEIPGKGTGIIGDNTRLAANREFFINTFVKRPIKSVKPINSAKIVSPAPNVEITALAFFGEEKSKPFRDAWLK